MTRLGGQISSIRVRSVENIPTKGPRNCRSLGFARDDKGEGDLLWKVVSEPKDASVPQPISMNRCPFLCHPERSRGICSSADLSWKCFSTERGGVERSAISRCKKKAGRTYGP
jgi:hypothetical protein